LVTQSTALLTKLARAGRWLDVNQFLHLTSSKTASTFPSLEDELGARKAQEDVADLVARLGRFP
jgi:hypothetical protein